MFLIYKTTLLTYQTFLFIAYVINSDHVAFLSTADPCHDKTVLTECQEYEKSGACDLMPEFMKRSCCGLCNKSELT